MTIHGSGVAGTVVGTASATVVAMSYTSGELLLIIAAVGTLVTIIGGQVVSIILTVQARKEVSRKLDENTAVTSVVAEKATSIEHATNSAATKSEEIITALRQQIKYQERAASEEKERSSTLAQAAAIALAHSVSGAASSPPSVAGEATGATASPGNEQSLKNIETHTKDTADNTARTDATVEDLKKER